MLGCRSLRKGQDTMLFRFTLNTQYSAACLTVTAAFTVSKIFKSWFSSVLFVKPFSPSRFLTGNPVRRCVVPIVGALVPLAEVMAVYLGPDGRSIFKVQWARVPARHFKCSQAASMRNTPQFSNGHFFRFWGGIRKKFSTALYKVHGAWISVCLLNCLWEPSVKNTPHTSNGHFFDKNQVSS